ncbi:MAG: GTP cyclohydrolase II [Candidatus Midichloriaceae bacterium]|jgi:GTP cyclohydrolase II
MKKGLVQVARCISDLKYGIPIRLKSLNEDCLLISAERIEKDLFENFQNQETNCQLLISKQRAKYLFQKDCSLKIDIQDMEYEQFQKLVFSLDFSQVGLKFNEASDLEKKSLDILQNAELIPSALIVSPNYQFDFLINSLFEVDYVNYLNCKNQVEEFCSSELLLKSGKANIKAFRSHFDKDHYAITIYPNKVVEDNDVPLVRVHSSCFTGDLLSSLRCDCFDQLQEAIKIMSENNGGILIYLNQEGRGIGLTNKVRVYKAQLQGLDTVEANECLGFDDDFRNFDIASKILKSLNISTIDLLSNNPKKAKELSNCNITVRHLVSHQFLQDNLQGYYKTKMKKMNHIIDI